MASMSFCILLVLSFAMVRAQHIRREAKINVHANTKAKLEGETPTKVAALVQQAAFDKLLDSKDQAVKGRSRSESHALHAQSKALHHKIQSYADKLAPGATRDFLRTLRLCAPCTKYERFGEDNDGGYVMCSDGLDKGLVGAYSYGINGFDGWGMAIASRYHIPLNEYDCTSSKRPVVCKGCDVHFHGECILNQDGDAAASANALKGVGDQRAADHEGEAGTTSKIGAASFKTLTQMLKDSGNANAAERSLMLKIDVESAEWKVFAQEPVENLKKFREIVVEYHWIHQVSNHKLYYDAVKKVEDAGFAVAHMHGNNFGGPMQDYGEFSIPDVIEVTYIQKPQAGCSADVKYHNDLDMSNSPNPSWAEMPDAVLPTSL